MSSEQMVSDKLTHMERHDTRVPILTPQISTKPLFGKDYYDANELLSALCFSQYFVNIYFEIHLNTNKTTIVKKLITTAYDILYRQRIFKNSKRSSL